MPFITFTSRRRLLGAASSISKVASELVPSTLLVIVVLTKTVIVNLGTGPTTGTTPTGSDGSLQITNTSLMYSATPPFLRSGGTATEPQVGEAAALATHDRNTVRNRKVRLVIAASR